MIVSDSATPFSVIMLRAELRALVAFASRDVRQPHMSAVVLRHDGAFATDGVTILAGYWSTPLPNFYPFVLERYPLRQLLRAIPPEGGVRITPNTIHPTNRAYIAVVNGLSLARKWEEAKPIFTASVPLVDAQPPKYETLLDQKVEEAETPSRFNALLLHRLRLVDKAAKASGYSAQGGVELDQGAERSPTRARWLGFEQRWTALVMPKFVDHDG